MSAKKKNFIVEEDETIHACLTRMESEGYRAVQRIEKPVFIEEKKKGKIEYKPISQKIIFVGEKLT